MEHRHYEFAILVSPSVRDEKANTGKEPALALINSYCNAITDAGGKVDRNEAWGKRQLAYTIKDHKLAYYFLLNITCTPEQKEELENKMRLNDAAILRYLCIKMDKPVTEPSPMMKKPQGSSGRFKGHDRSKKEA